MPTIITHAVVPLALAVAAGPSRISPRLALTGAMLAMLPDADVIGFRLGIDYADSWGHRGATHSLAIAAILTAVLAVLWREVRRPLALTFLFLAVASHGLLDMATDGGLGVSLWWPVDEARMFWPVTPVRVSPIGVKFFSARGLETVWSEMLWVWLPCALLGIASLIRRQISPPHGLS
ncbi:metal-dependent hydrolase [uncultured Sphingorhabdus sp.]|uniref:metal-dependent hydrolase n=1 Tax=uncultured Sphingorhabdus sp. TaxID=1686106 RepID=UPI0026204C99|nr:metal-dependent hydrolase [uncultured Sphingorhabdus sp.]HMS21056.1 metal-dependent hydrolase [Sphingorhabdus sp.]